jgi:hypothetical protein
MASDQRLVGLLPVTGSAFCPTTPRTRNREVVPSRSPFLTTGRLQRRLTSAHYTPSFCQSIPVIPVNLRCNSTVAAPPIQQRRRRFRLGLGAACQAGRPLEFRVGVGQHRSPAPPGGSLLAALGEILVADLGSGPGAGDDLLHGTEGVTVGGKDTQVVAASDAMPVVDPVIFVSVHSTLVSTRRHARGHWSPHARQSGLRRRSPNGALPSVPNPGD